MTPFTDSLRGYAFEVHKADGWVCQYCGLVGTDRFSDWLILTWGHFLPRDHQKRDDVAHPSPEVLDFNPEDAQWNRQRLSGFTIPRARTILPTQEASR